MVAITASTGIGSGLDISGLVNTIVSAEGTPIVNRLNLREAELQAKLSAYGSLKGALSAFQTTLASLQTTSSFNQKSVTSSDEDIVTASSTSSVAAGTYDLTVTQRALSQTLSIDTSITDGQFTSEDTVIGTGTLTFKFGTTTLDDPDPGDYTFVQDTDAVIETVEITDGSLKGIRDAVNDADIGVTAAIVFDGTYQVLTFTAEGGANNSMAITVDDDDLGDADTSGLSLLSYDETNGQNLVQNTDGQDAVFSLNGVTVNSETNTVTTAIDGLTFNLLADTGSATLTVTKDTDYASSNISSFVAKYNALISTINDLSKYDADTGVAGILNGDGVLRNITSQLRSTLGNSIANLSGSYTILAEVGITSSSTDGTLVLDNDELGTAMSSDLENVMQLFAAVGTSTNSFVEYVSSTDNTLIGSYDINITQLATQGSLTSSGSTAADLTIAEGVDDSLTISIDGVATTVTLGAGTYTAAELATELQSRINGADDLADAGISVTVTQTSGVLKITSNSYGSDSTISISGEALTLEGLFGAGGTSNTDGKDVAGTIGGYEATGEGQYLIGEQAAVDLKIKIEGTTTGDRGSVTFTHGYAKQLDDMLEELLESDGLFTTVTDGVQDRIDGISVQREELDRRLTIIEDRVRAKFIAMDAIVASLRVTSDFLTQQLASLPKITVKGSK